MKTIYKIAIGAGSTATVATAVVVPTVVLSNKKQSTPSTNQTNVSPKQNIQTQHVNPLQADFDYANSALLQRLIELGVVAPETTVEAFEKDFANYVPGMVRVATEFTAEDLTNIVDLVIGRFENKIPQEIQNNLLKVTPEITAAIVKNNFVSETLELLNYTKKTSIDSLLETLDSRLDLVKASLLLSKILKSIPNLSDEATTAVISLVKSIPALESISSILPDDEDAIKAYEALLNSGLFSNLGQLLESAVEKGIGNIDFDALKAGILKTVDDAKEFIKNSGILTFLPVNVTPMIDSVVASLKIDKLVDIVKKVVTEGIFALDGETVEELKNIDTNLLTLLSSLVPAIQSYEPVVKNAIALLDAVTSKTGIASLEQGKFDEDVNSILSLIPSLPTNIEPLISKLLFNKFDSAKDMIDSIESLLPNSILTANYPVVGNVRDIIEDILRAAYEGKAYHKEFKLFFVTAASINFTEDEMKPLSLLFSSQNGILGLSKEQIKSVLVSIEKLAGSVFDVLNGGIVKFIGGAIPQLGEIKPIIAAVKDIPEDVVSEVSDSIYDATHTGLTSSEAEIRKSVDDMINYFVSKHISISEGIKSVIFAATSGLDHLTQEQALGLTDFIYSFIPKSTPLASSIEFKNTILTLLFGKDNADAYLATITPEQRAAEETKLNADRQAAAHQAELDRVAAEKAAAEAAKAAAAKAEAERLAAAKAAAQAADKVLIAAYVPTLNGIASIDEALKAKSANSIRATDIIFAQPTNGLKITVKSLHAEQTNLEITFVVSSASGVTAEHRETITGFAEFKGISVPDVVEAIKQLLADNHIVLGTSPVQSVTTKAEKLIKDYLLAHFPAAQAEINALHAGDLLTAYKNPSEYGGLDVLYKHSDVTSFAQLKQFTVISVYQKVAGNVGTDMKHRLDALFDALDR